MIMSQVSHLMNCSSTFLRMADEEPNVSEGLACAKLIDRALSTSSAVKTLMLAMERAGCPVNRSFFSCERCEQDCQGGYDRDRGVILCQQHMQNSAALIESTMVHELIHAFDDCRAHVNWTDLKHHACTEIRAANLSGDCSFTQEFARGNFNVRAQQQKCVRRRAELSVAMNPSSNGAHARLREAPLHLPLRAS
jgi:inner membrane protease ATP23